MTETTIPWIDPPLGLGFASYVISVLAATSDGKIPNKTTIDQYGIGSWFKEMFPDDSRKYETAIQNMKDIQLFHEKVSEYLSKEESKRQLVDEKSVLSEAVEESAKKRMSEKEFEKMKNRNLQKCFGFLDDFPMSIRMKMEYLLRELGIEDRPTMIWSDEVPNPENGIWYFWKNPESVMKWTQYEKGEEEEEEEEEEKKKKNIRCPNVNIIFFEGRCGEKLYGLWLYNEREQDNEEEQELKLMTSAANVDPEKWKVVCSIYSDCKFTPGRRRGEGIESSLLESKIKELWSAFPDPVDDTTTMVNFGGWMCSRILYPMSLVSLFVEDNSDQEIRGGVETIAKLNRSSSYQELKEPMCYLQTLIKNLQLLLYLLRRDRSKSDQDFDKRVCFEILKWVDERLSESQRKTEEWKVLKVDMYIKRLIYFIMLDEKDRFSYSDIAAAFGKQHAQMKFGKYINDDDIPDFKGGCFSRKQDENKAKDAIAGQYKYLSKGENRLKRNPLDECDVLVRLDKTEFPWPTERPNGR